MPQTNTRNHSTSAGSSINMPLPGLPNMPRMPGLGASNNKKKPDIKILFDPAQKTYSTLDLIEGHVEITAHVDTPFCEVTIEFIGTSRTFVEKMSTAAAMSGRTEAYHNFLRLDQPNLDRLYPQGSAFKAGETYKFPFMFKVPEMLLLRACNHSTKHDSVRDAHMLLPPTLGDRELAAKDGSLDDLAPEMASVRYGIFVKVQRTEKHGEEVKRYPLANKARRLRIVPAVDELPPEAVEDDAGDRTKTDYYLRSEKKLKKGILKSKLGTLVMEAEQPKSLRLHAPNSSSDAPITTSVRVMLRFEPEPGVTQPPRLDKMTTKLKVRTFFSTTARKTKPNKGDHEFDACKGFHGENIELSSRAIRKVDWQIEDLAHPKLPLQERRASAQLPSAIDQTWIPAPSSTYVEGAPFQYAEIKVPVQLPSNKNFVPTFHSCLMSRVYILALSLTPQIPGLGVSLDIRIPVQISAAPSEAEDSEARRASVASAQMDTDVEDGIEGFFGARPPPGSPRDNVGSDGPASPELARRVQEPPPDYEDVAPLPPAWSHHIGRRDVGLPLLPVR